MARGTLVQKIIERHMLSGEALPGARIGLKIDQTLTQDATGTMAYLELEAMNVEKVRTELSVSYVDHNMSQNGPENRNDHLYLQTVAQAKSVLFSRPGNGICHQVHLERFGAPGKTLLGSDSHTPTGGGLGMLSIGAGGLDVALAMAGKPFRMSYPHVVGVKLSGKLRPWVSAKDIILKMLQTLSTKGNVGKLVEYFGDALPSLSVPERATVCNMGAELGVTSSIFPSDKMTKAFLKAQGRLSDWVLLEKDPDAEYDELIEIDLSTLEPLAACPSSPDKIKSISELSGIPVDQVIIGSCTNSSYADLMLVTEMLKGKTVHKNVSLSIAPGSRQVLSMLGKSGALASLIASGARILESACGPCIGQGMSPADNTVSLRTFNRNFAGRTGTKNDKAYLVSPAVAATAALKGVVADPASLGIPFPTIKSPAKFLVDDEMIIRPDGEKIEIIRKPTIGRPPVNTPMPESIDGRVIIKTGDKITTDHIMPAGQFLKFRSNIPVYANYVFDCFNEKGRKSFSERALEAKGMGLSGIIVGGESYGQGSSREHAAICPMYLGIRVLIAKSIERIHAANLLNFGILPLAFADDSDYGRISEGDALRICEIRKSLRVGETLGTTLEKQDGAKLELLLKHSLTADDIDVILAGGILNAC